MKNQELFDRTVGILVKAYFNETLLHYNCCACAVGNLVAANLHYKFNSENYWEEQVSPQYDNGWASVFATSGSTQKMNRNNYHLIASAKEQIDATGYTITELARIELAFERAYEYKDTDNERFDGLMNVIDALQFIHKATPAEAQSAKELFVLTEG